jgi:hypothetical protein
VDAEGEGATATLVDVTLRGTGPDATGEPNGYGVFVHDGATATLDTVTIEDNQLAGVLARGAGTEVSAEDLQVAGTAVPEGEDPSGAGGVVADQGASLTLSRAVLDGNTAHGAIADGEASSLSFTDVAISGTAPDASRQLGIGLRVADGATFTAERTLIDGNRSFGVLADGASSVSFVDALIRDTAPTESTGRFGRGVQVDGGGTFAMTHSQILESHEAGLGACGEGTSIDLDQVLVADVADRPCADLPETDGDYCAPGRVAGVVARDGATLAVDDVEIARSANVGLQLADGSTATGTALRIHDCPVGVNLRSVPDGYDFLEALDELLLSGNDVDIDTSDEIRVPECIPR